MRIGHLERIVDCSGVSGCGRVAEIVRFSDGSIAAHWLGSHPCTSVWKNLEDLLFVHGHSGATEVVWDVPEISPDGVDTI